MLVAVVLARAFFAIEEVIHVVLDDHVLDVQERGAVEADVDERGLHAGQHACDFA